RPLELRRHPPRDERAEAGADPVHGHAAVEELLECCAVAVDTLERNGIELDRRPRADRVHVGRRQSPVERDRAHPTAPSSPAGASDSPRMLSITLPWSAANSGEETMS